MSTLTKEQIKAAALELDPAEREALADALYCSVHQADQEPIDEALLEEITRREAEYLKDPGSAIPVEVSIENILRKAAK